jgi:hypothetical protein
MHTQLTQMNTIRPKPRLRTVDWESVSTAARTSPGFGGRLRNVYRASGRPA